MVGVGQCVSFRYGRKFQREYVWRALDFHGVCPLCCCCKLCYLSIHVSVVACFVFFIAEIHIVLVMYVLLFDAIGIQFRRQGDEDMCCYFVSLLC